MKQFFALMFLLFFLFFPIGNTQASVVGFANTGLWIQPSHYVLEGETIRFFANIVNGEYEVFKGDLIFYINNQIVGKTISFELKKEESRIFSTSWIAVAGEFEVTAQIENVCFVCTSSGQPVETQLPDSLLRDYEKLIVDQDSDKDGLGNAEEKRLGTDPFKVDTDGDGYSDKEELDAGTNPLGSTSFPGPDTDGDGISDKVDTDIDNDGLYNWEEEALGTDPYKRDTDNDGVGDKEDCHPLNPAKWLCEKEGGDIQKDIKNSPQILAHNYQNNNQPSQESDFLNFPDNQSDNQEISSSSLNIIENNNLSVSDISIITVDDSRDQKVLDNQEQGEISLWKKFLNFLSLNQKQRDNRVSLIKENISSNDLEDKNTKSINTEENKKSLEVKDVLSLSFTQTLILLLLISLATFLTSLFFFLLAKKRKEKEEQDN